MVQQSSSASADRPTLAAPTTQLGQRHSFESTLDNVTRLDSLQIPFPFVFDFAVTTLVFDLFSGMGGLHHALVHLQIDCCEGLAIIMFEVDSKCRDILGKHVSRHCQLSSFCDSEGACGSVF